MSDEKIEKPDNLDDLLDDALKDFKDDGKSKSKDNTSGKSETTEVDEKSNTDASDTDAFVMEQAKAFSEYMNTFLGGLNTPSGEAPSFPQDPQQILAGYQKMAEAAAMTLQGENSTDGEEVAKYTDSITQALRGLQEGSENLSAPVLETDVSSMFSGMNLGGAEGEGAGNAFLPFMEGMMQSLLSAEILLPSIKELLEKYPKYLEENGDKIPAQDKERYEKQLELYKVIEAHLESEKADDSFSVKQEKFRVVLDDMRKLQEYGQPPPEILAETAGDLPLLDPASVGANPQCPMM